MRSTSRGASIRRTVRSLAGRGTALVVAALALALFAAARQSGARDAQGAQQAQQAEQAPAPAGRQSPTAPAVHAPQQFTGPCEPDEFHPDHLPRADGTRAPAPPPRRGGQVTVRLETTLRNLNFTIENSAVTRRVLYEVHETLLLGDWETFEWKPRLAREWWVEDALVLRPEAEAAWKVGGTRLGSAPDAPLALYGRVEPNEDGWRVVPLSPQHALAAPVDVPRDAVARVELGTVFTFALRDDAVWHDGHPFDARDVIFSWELYRNPHVNCGESRSAYAKVVRGDQLGPHAVRFFYATQYFKAHAIVADLNILPAHLYDLTDPDNAERVADASAATDERRGAYVNENRHNLEWVGLGPYRVTKCDGQVVEAERFDRYFDPADGGWLDRIRWRVITDDQVAMQALLNGELDFQDRVTSDDYFGEVTEKPLFADRFYKGYFYTGIYGYLCWNSHRPALADVRVRRALAHAIDLEAWRTNYYKGLAVRVTGHQPFFSPANDPSVEPLAFDLARARALLAQAGWFDRDGDGRADRDGKPLRLEHLVLAGNDSTTRFGQFLQESLARVGVEVAIQSLEWQSFSDRRGRRDFDSLWRGWVVPPETDLEQVFHSRWGAPGSSRTANDSGLCDPETDRLIERAQRELDDAARAEIWRAAQRRLHELQPYLFGINAPRKFAMSRDIRGFQIVRYDPNYVIRRWYRVD